MQLAGAGRCPLGPAVAECAGKAIEHAKAAALSGKEAGGQKHSNAKTDRDRDCYSRPRFESQQPGQRDRGVGDLREEFEGDVDDRARRSGAAGNPRDSDRPRAGDIAADLGKRQHFGRGVADEPRPDRRPRACPRQQCPPGNAHHRNQHELNQADRGKTRPPDGEQGADHRSRAEMDDERPEQ